MLNDKGDCIVDLSYYSVTDDICTYYMDLYQTKGYESLESLYNKVNLPLVGYGDFKIIIGKYTCEENLNSEG